MLRAPPSFASSPRKLPTRKADFSIIRYAFFKGPTLPWVPGTASTTRWTSAANCLPILRAPISTLRNRRNNTGGECDDDVGDDDEDDEDDEDEDDDDDDDDDDDVKLKVIVQR